MAYTWKPKWPGQKATKQDDRETIRRRTLESGRLAELSSVSPRDGLNQNTCADCGYTLMATGGGYKCSCNEVPLKGSIVAGRERGPGPATSPKRGREKREKRRRGRG